MKHKINGGYRVRIETTLSKIKKVQTRILYKGREREREKERMEMKRENCNLYGIAAKLEIFIPKLIYHYFR